MNALLQPADFSDLCGWYDDDHKAAFDAFCISAARMVETPYKTRALGVKSDALVRIASEALRQSNVDADGARNFFEKHFQPHSIAPGPSRKTGFLTGYWEPEVQASRVQSTEFSVPLYRRPPELVEISDTDRPATMDPSFRYARKTDDGFEEYFTRGEIQRGALAGRGLELAWLASKEDAFFIHVQGSARLTLDDGGAMRVTYAAKSGHPYTSLGKVMIERLGVAQAEMTTDVLRNWMEAHPDELDEFLALNKSFIFFEEVTGLPSDSGPIAAAKVSLVPGRSLAVDRTLHTFGSPVWISTHEPLPGDEKPTNRLMIAHDTGSAIVDAARGDIFMGTGGEAGLIAGKIQHSTDMAVLVPRKGV